MTNSLNLLRKFRKLNDYKFCYLKSMSRALCLQCQRPEKACICAFAVNVANHIDVLVLQHPSEVKQSKGTVTLLQQSLSSCEVIVGEDFSQCQLLTERLAYYGDKIALLYPSEQALELSTQSAELVKNKLSDIKCLIILDGTWKKAYRIFMLNPCLHKIKHIILPQGIASLYQIRKTKKNNALSSLEACCHALIYLENKAENYQALLDSFVKFNQFQQSFSKSV